MKAVLCILLCLVFVSLAALPVALDVASRYAQALGEELFPKFVVDHTEVLSAQGKPLAYVYHLSPTGFIVISARDELPPLIAYSDNGSFHAADGSRILAEMISTDISNRLEYLTRTDHEAWERALSADFLSSIRNARNYLLSTNWTQNYPYNMMCPMDLVTNQRSIAGCPAIAMGQIVNYLQALNGTRLNDTDDYYHNYAGRSYWIDNDHDALGFPSFTGLNGYLDEINYRFRYDLPLSDSLKAALVFASGTALKQVYTSAGSGTFAVNQAYAAFQRFGFSDCELISLDSPELYIRMASNIQQGFPVHLAVVTPAWDAGHNVVVDGYNDEGYFHLNFGWGGSYNGWYLLPSQIPYSLTVIEGAIVDIFPKQFISSLPDEITLQTGQATNLMIINQESRDIVLEAWRVGPETDPQNWTITGASPFPIVIPALGITELSISYNEPVRDWFSTTLKLILDEGVHKVLLHYESGSATDDPAIPAPTMQVQCYPNPSRDRASILISKASSSALEIAVYNKRGERIRTIHEGRISQRESCFEWDGRDSKGNPVPTGIYFVRAVSGKESILKKIVRM